MSGEIALDTSVAVRFLNGDTAIVSRVLALPEVVLPTVVVGELLFGAENSTRPLQNLPRYLEFINSDNFVNQRHWLRQFFGVCDRRCQDDEYSRRSPKIG